MIGSEAQKQVEVNNELLVGLDVGSTTVKAVVLDVSSGTECFRAYRRHRARQAEEAAAIIGEIGQAFPGASLTFAVTGSGGAPLAKALDAAFFQEVVSNAAAVGRLYPQARTVIELGGQDAKIIFFTDREGDGHPEVSDMRMNGSCAGGTGAFIDEMATILAVPVEEFNDLAAKGSAVHPISGRCGVFAKTDIQPLAAAGVPKEDLALSVFHAIAKQTIGGLAQGHPIEAPVVFEGGPLLFNPVLVGVFAKRLGLKQNEVLVPEHPETVVALGAALLLSDLPREQRVAHDARSAQHALEYITVDTVRSTPPLFENEFQRWAFEERHISDAAPKGPQPGETSAYLGIDSGSTTTKIVLVSEDGTLLDSVYAASSGDPLSVAQRALVELRDRWSAAGGQLKIEGLGVTGYGEELFYEAYRADVRIVETVAHARAALAYRPTATFVLDIGGQDMKALWINDGVVSDIVVNEACSSGCGSFLEGFATSLGIERDQLAEVAFTSEAPADLGSRCTVFMNSGIITAQRMGKTPADIIAGLARSVVENVFTKVIRVSNLDSLGNDVVVQGGTFANDAVLRAFEQYLGHNVSRTPHPELAGAIGAALAAQEHIKTAGETKEYQTRFIGLDAVAELSFTRESGVVCELCSNHCERTIVRFSSGAAFATGNRCSRGAIVTTQDESTDSSEQEEYQPQDLFSERAKLLFKKYPFDQILPENGTVIGLPRALSLWDNAPFWIAFFKSLGFTVRLSSPSSRTKYEASLSAIPSDTACFPAKLVHSHIRDLVQKEVDAVFMPIITAVKPEGVSPSSESMCALVKGYPMVIRSVEDPEEYSGIPLESPMFCWRTEGDRERQLSSYMQQRFNIDPKQTHAALEQGDKAQHAFRSELERRAKEIMAAAHAQGSFTVVLAGRPYHSDPLVCHDLAELFIKQGLSVIPVDSLPGLSQVGLEKSRLDIVNNYHARMLAGSLYAARSKDLEFAQIVSFGCGHDAYLTDEIIRMMKDTSNKVPLVLKVDEGDATGPLGIRVRSFVETIQTRRRKERKDALTRESIRSTGSDPYPVKFLPEDRKQKIVLVPNTSHAFGRLMAAVFSRQGLQAIPLDLGGEEAIRLGKKYTHNDICFPAQMVIGEALVALESGKYDPDNTAVGMAKYLGDCRLTHYSALLRKALDDAGFSQVPIITNDDKDERNLHPGFHMSIASALRIAYCLPMIDALEELLRKMRPYELEEGAANRAFEQALDQVIEGVEKGGMHGAKRGFKEAIEIMKGVRYDRSNLRPRVLIVGEYLLNFHPGANRGIEDYLERSGMEIIEARMTDVIRKTYFYQNAQVHEQKAERKLGDRMFLGVAERAFEVAHNVTDRIASEHPLYEPPCRMPELVKASDDIVHHVFDAGEGVLIPAEILHHYEHGARSFVILQPFGCLPNHIVGRGIVNSLRKRCPDARILALDYDPDVSMANIENRLQMLVAEAKKDQ